MEFNYATENKVMGIKSMNRNRCDYASIFIITVTVFACAVVLANGIYLYKIPGYDIWDIFPTWYGWLAIYLYSAKGLTMFRNMSIKEVIATPFTIHYKTIGTLSYLGMLGWWAVFVGGISYLVHSNGAVITNSNVPDTLLLLSFFTHAILHQVLEVIVQLRDTVGKKVKLSDVVWMHSSKGCEDGERKYFLHSGHSSLDIVLQRNSYVRYACMLSIGNDEHNIHLRLAFAGYSICIATGSCFGLGYPLFNDSREIGFSISDVFLRLSFLHSDMGHNVLANGWNTSISLEEMREGKITHTSEQFLPKRKFVVNVAKTSKTPLGEVLVEVDAERVSTISSKKGFIESTINWNVVTFKRDENDPEAVVIPGKGENSWDQDDRYGMDISMGGYDDKSDYHAAIVDAAKSYGFFAHHIDEFKE